MATAPWNRQWLTDEPTYRGVGYAFMVHAIRKSYEIGLNGRVNGFALQKAESFYVTCGAKPTDEKASDGTLFEIEPKDALPQIGVTL